MGMLGPLIEAAFQVALFASHANKGLCTYTETTKGTSHSVILRATPPIHTNWSPTGGLSNAHDGLWTLTRTGQPGSTKHESESTPSSHNWAAKVLRRNRRGKGKKTAREPAQDDPPRLFRPTGPSMSAPHMPGLVKRNLSHARLFRGSSKEKSPSSKQGSPTEPATSKAEQYVQEHLVQAQQSAARRQQKDRQQKSNIALSRSPPHQVERQRFMSSVPHCRSGSDVSEPEPVPSAGCGSGRLPPDTQETGSLTDEDDDDTSPNLTRNNRHRLSVFSAPERDARDGRSQLAKALAQSSAASQETISTSGIKPPKYSTHKEATPAPPGDRRIASDLAADAPRDDHSGGSEPGSPQQYRSSRSFD
eukprot:NODE_1881_length_1269_cov_8.867213_g1557_i0.p1 GENE.NODE_1881_length_1269_cov_8.867213_g1557_i0~~NODE_1881_length_1269_cov_8.867213_g1557_i0.p1  ORF type:complete len:397 (+),score=32.92 NODE_1881_length_1269_cov_8.867213_g1557_i0:106-1191(+)